MIRASISTRSGYTDRLYNASSLQLATEARWREIFADDRSAAIDSEAYCVTIIGRWLD